MREHLIVTPQGNIAHIEQLPARRHDVQGLYALLNTSFTGHLVADNGYWPNPKMRELLLAHGIQVTAGARANQRQQPSAHQKRLLKKRQIMEPRISGFNRSTNADRTLCRRQKHHRARRWVKALGHNARRRLNPLFGCTPDAWLRFHTVA